jgi:hypothetical protein
MVEHSPHQYILVGVTMLSVIMMSAVLLILGCFVMLSVIKLYVILGSLVAALCGLFNIYV